MKFGNSIFKTFFLSLCIIANISFAYAQTASILPNAKTTFVDQNGKPLTSGTVDFYVPGTSTRKTTWQDSSQAVPNTNPVVLDAAGRAQIWGDGAYRQVVKDRNGNLIWDQVTSSIGSGGSSGSTIGDGLPVGTILPTSDIIAPSNYQFAYGQAVARATFPELLAAITVATTIGCTGGSPTINVTDTSYISVGTVLESICIAGSPTVISKTSSSVTMSANATVTVSTSARFFPYGNGDALTTFNLPDLRGYIVAGRCNMGGVDCSTLNSTYFSSNSNNTPSSVNAKGGSQSRILSLAQIPTGITSTSFQNISVNTASGQHFPIANANWAGTTIATAGAANIAFTAGSVGDATSLNGNNTINVTSNNTGGQAFSLVPPTLTLNYIIKVTPDVNLTSSYGVAAIGGMTGVIACGTNLTCSGNTISVTYPSGVTSLGGMTGGIACGSGLACSAGTISSAGVNSFNGRTGAVVPVAGDYDVSKGGTGVTNLIGHISGLQPLKLTGSVIGVNPGTWASNTGTATFSSTSVLTADFQSATPNFAVSPATGAQVSGALSASANSTDGTEVFLYLVHRNSDGKPALIGSSADTQGPNNNTFTATAAAPGVMTFGSIHGLRKRMMITVSNSGGALPSPLAAGVAYFVCTTPTTSSITLATSIANVNSGSCLTFTTTGSGTNTATWGVQAELDFRLGAGVATFDRRLPYFAFVWSWSKYGSTGIPGGTNGIPDFQVAQQASDTIITNASQAVPFRALNGGTAASWTAVDLSDWLANVNRRVLIFTACRYPASIGGCFVRARGGGGTGIQVGAPTVVNVDSVGLYSFQTDSTTQIEYQVTGGAALSIYIMGWTFVDPS